MPAPGLPGQAAARVGIALIVLVVEYMALALVYDGNAIRKLAGPWSRLADAGEIVEITGASVAAAVVLWRHLLFRGLEGASRPIWRIDWRWLAVHPVVYAVFFALCGRVFAPPAPTGAAAIVLLGAWLACGATLVFSLLRGLLGGAIYQTIRSVRVALLLGVSFGALVWFVAVESRLMWGWLAHRTLSFSAALLQLFSDGVSVHAETAEIALDGFGVEVAPQCSGIEGMALIGLFMAGYLYRFRAECRFPNAWLLIPLGMGLAWLANGVRIAGLLAVGAWVSSEVAYEGFHSKAGWLLFCLMAVGLTYLSRRSPFFSRNPPAAADEYENPVAVYCMPALVLLGIGMLTGAFASAIDLLYPLRVLGAALVMVAYRTHHRNIEWGVSARAVLIGVATFGIWMVFPPPMDFERNAEVGARLDQLDAATRGTWLVFRVVGSVLVVPFAEELAFRGYLQRRLIAEDFTEVSLRHFRWPSFAITSLAFGSLHPNWIAGTLAGAAFSAAAYSRGRIADAVIAHATTNLLLSAWVLVSGAWHLW